jgi:hypothetical protein
MLNIRQIFSLSAIPLIAVFVTGCNKVESSINQAAGSIGIAAEKPAREDLTGKKLDAYAELMNRYGQRVLRSYERYVAWCNPKTGPTGRERPVNGLYTVADPAADLTKAELLIAKPSNVDVFDRVAKDYGTRLRDIRPLLEEAAHYYEQEDYKDDGMAKGRQMHGKLIAAFEGFEKATAVLQQEFEKIHDLQVTASIVKYKASGDELSAMFLGNTMRAKHLLSAGRGGLKTLELTTFQEQVKAMEDQLRAMRVHIKQNKQALETKEVNVGNYEGYIEHAAGFLKQAKELSRAKRDGLQRTSQEDDYFIATYNTMINASNNVALPATN